jgi:cytochrome c-type biogenesis protein
MELTVWLAFIAGIVSFISPCVLPLVPAYIGYMGGRITYVVATTSGAKVKTAPTLNRRFMTVTHGLAFVAGFTFVFVTLGLFSTAFVTLIGGQNITTVTGIIGRIGGLLIIFFGLHFMGVLPAIFTRLRAVSGTALSIIFALIGIAVITWGFIGTLSVWDNTQMEFVPFWASILALVLVTIFLLWLLLSGAFTSPIIFWTKTFNSIQQALYTDTRRQMSAPGQGGYASSALMGVIFSAGWTPCIGPVYGAVLTLAANGGSVGQAGALLTAYSLGLGIPFLITAWMLDSVQGMLRHLQTHMHKIEIASGAFLILIGVFVASGQLQSLSQQFAGQFADFSVNLENSVIDLVDGDQASAEPTSEPSVSSLVITNPETSQTSPLDATAEPLSAISSIAELAANAPPIGTTVGSYAPMFETVTDGGLPVRLTDLRGKIVLLNFWATWCGPCRVEMPEFEKAYNAHKDEGFTILAVNNVETVAQVQEFRDQMKVTFPLLMDESGSIQSIYGIISYPSTYVLDREGIITARHFGPLTAELIQQLVSDALAN